nr:hypothetical protein DM860_010389 [Ipomoea batatas]
MAIAKGFQWAWDKGIRDSEVQFDAWDVLKWIEGQHTLKGPIIGAHQASEWKEHFLTPPGLVDIIVEDKMDVPVVRRVVTTLSAGAPPPL